MERRSFSNTLNRIHRRSKDQKDRKINMYQDSPLLRTIIHYITGCEIVNRLNLKITIMWYLIEILYLSIDGFY